MRQATPQDLVVEVVHQHAEMLLRVARRYTDSADDAQDAYQRALEVFVRSAHRLDAEKAHHWLAVVVRNEALAVRRQRAQLVGVGEVAGIDAFEDGRSVASIEERTEHVDEMARAAEALRRLKPHEVTALWLKAQGLSYKEIAERQGWTYTKVNRSITEGRRSFMERLHGIESGAECERWTPMLSAMADGEASAEELSEVRPHLRNCAACRASLADLRRTQAQVAALLPPAAVVGGGLSSRLAELMAWGQERLVGTATRVQAAAEAVGAGKAAAVVASTAAIAGGGVVAEQQLQRDAGAAAPTPPAAAQRAAAPAPAPVAQPGSAGQALAATSERRERPERRGRKAPQDAVFAPEAERPPVEQPPPVTQAPERTPSTTDVFGFEGG
jgi:RNA polymerase sigma factor (sigma-70 family)